MNKAGNRRRKAKSSTVDFMRQTGLYHVGSGSGLGCKSEWRFTHASEIVTNAHIAVIHLRLVRGGVSNDRTTRARFTEQHAHGNPVSRRERKSHLPYSSSCGGSMWKLHTYATTNMVQVPKIKNCRVLRLTLTIPCYRSDKITMKPDGKLAINLDFTHLPR